VVRGCGEFARSIWGRKISLAVRKKRRGLCCIYRTEQRALIGGAACAADR
jgi:hypothetical protein